MQASYDPIERMVSFLLSSPPIQILPTDNYLNRNKKTGRPPRIDYDAILDLLRDGKGARKVAVEVGCSPLSVYRVLDAYNLANPSDVIELPPYKFGRPRVNL